MFILQAFFHKAVMNDTLFLSIVNVVDYSILVGFDEEKQELVVGIIDYMRQVNLFLNFCFFFHLFSYAINALPGYNPGWGWLCSMILSRRWNAWGSQLEC